MSVLRYLLFYWTLSFLCALLLMLAIDIFAVEDRSLFESRETWIGVLTVPAVLVLVVAFGDSLKQIGRVPLLKAIGLQWSFAIVRLIIIVVLFDVFVVWETSLIGTVEAWVAILLISAFFGVIVGVSNWLKLRDPSSRRPNLFEILERRTRRH